MSTRDQKPSDLRSTQHAEAEAVFSAEERALLRSELGPSASTRARVRDTILSSVATGALTPAAQRVDTLMHHGQAAGVASTKSAAATALQLLNSKLLVMSLVVASGGTALYVHNAAGPQREAPAAVSSGQEPAAVGSTEGPAAVGSTEGPAAVSSGQAPAAVSSGQAPAPRPPTRDAEAPPLVAAAPAGDSVPAAVAVHVPGAASPPAPVVHTPAAGRQRVKPAAATPAAPASAAPAARSAAAASIASASAAAVAPAAATPVAPAAATPAPVPSAPAENLHKTPAEPASASEASTAKTVQLRLAEEVMLVKSASDALQQKNPQAALRALQRYTSEFPGGALQVEADALRAIALCQAHAPNSAAVSAQFRGAHAHSALAERVQQACSAQGQAK